MRRLHYREMPSILFIIEERCRRKAKEYRVEMEEPKRLGEEQNTLKTHYFGQMAEKTGES